MFNSQISWRYISLTGAEMSLGVWKPVQIIFLQIPYVASYEKFSAGFLNNLGRII